MRHNSKTPRPSAPKADTSPARRLVACLLALLLYTQAMAPAALARAAEAPRPKAGGASGPAGKARVEGGAGAASAPVVQAPAAQSYGIVLSPLGTAFGGVVGLDYHQPTGKLVASANSPTGLPNNFELIESDGARRAFSNLTGLAGELKIAAARDDDGRGLSLGGFRAGEVLTGTGAAGVIARVEPDGSRIQPQWVTLPAEAGLPNGLHLDRTGVFAGDLVTVTTAGGVWRVKSTGAATRVAELGTPLSGVVTIPADADKYGPWAGKILAGAEAQGLVYAVDAQGAAEPFDLGVRPGDLRVTPAHENFYAVDPGEQKVWGAQAAALAGMVGDVLVAQASPGALARVHWNGAEFEVSHIASAAQFKQIAFAPAGVAPIAGVGQVYEKIAVVRHAPVLSGGRVEGSLWQLLGEAVSLGGNSVITSDLLVPGTPTVSRSDNSAFGGVVTGTGGTQPSDYTVALSGNASLRYLMTRTNPTQLEPVAAPPAPAGTRDVSLSQAGQSAGSFSTLRDLTLSGKAGAVAVPPGTYGRFSAGGRDTAFVLGVADSAEPSAYNLEELSLSGGGELRVVGPVVLTVKGNVTLSGSSAGAANAPRRLSLRVAAGGVNLSGNGVLYALVRAPQGAVSVSGNGRLRGTVACDRLNVSGNGVIQVTENDLPPPPVNRFPVADAGPDQTITLPTDTVSLSGSASDDGLPEGATLDTVWSKVSGPGPVAFGDARAPATTATFTEPGTYVLRLSAADTLLVSKDEVTVTVVPRNQPPAVSAGAEQTIELPDTATLVGTVSDDALPRGSTTTVEWSKVNGPGDVTFADPAAATTTAGFSVHGLYTLALTATDTELTAVSTVVVNVHPENRAPTVNAGADQAVTLPNDASLTGSVQDDGYPLGGALTSTWSVVSGPGAAVFGDPHAPSTVATFAEPGTYVLRLSADDTRATAADEITVVVDPRNLRPEVNAGADQAVEIPNSLTLGGSVSDDGYPRGASVTRSWDVVSGPGSVSFDDPTSPTASATFGSPGTYTLRLTANDTEFSVSDEVVVTARPENRPPTANAGEDSTVRLPAAAPLVGSVADDGWPHGSTLTASWTKVSGPGDVTFADPAAAQTSATFGAPGEYVLRLTASDTRVSASDEVKVTALPANVGPTVSAGPDGPALLDLNLLRNAGNEGLLIENKIPFWGSPDGGLWAQGPAGAPPFSLEGGTYFHPAGVTASELRQDVDVSAFAAAVEGGAQQFAFEGYVRAASPSEGSRIFVEYRDAANAAVLASFDTGDVTSPEWLRVADRRAAPAGTRWVRVRLVAADNNAAAAGGLFDGLSLRAVSAAAVALEGVVTDDGLPAGSSLSVAWGKLSGPGEVVFANPAAAATSAVFKEPGTYVLRLTANDSEFEAADEVTVTVARANQPPTADAGADLTVKLDEPAALEGSFTDDGLPAGAGVSVSWSKLSGPGAVTFADAAAPATAATFGEPGAYVLRLSASDTEFTIHDEVRVTVEVRNAAPSVGAGPDQTVTLPASASLDGTVTDDGLPAGAALSVQWSKVSGPGAVTFSNPNAADTSASFGADGTYVLRLSADDSALSGSDDVTVVVQPVVHNVPVGVDDAYSLDAGAATEIKLPALFSAKRFLTLPGAFAGIVVSPDGKLYAANLNLNVYEIDLATKNVRTVLTGRLSWPGKLLLGDGRPLVGTDLILADNNAQENPSNCCDGRVFRINRQTGAVSVISNGNPTFNPPGDPFGVALGPGGLWGSALYVMDFEGSSPNPPVLFRVNDNGTRSTFVTNPQVWTRERFPTDIAFSPHPEFGDYLYAIDGAQGGGDPVIWRVSPQGELSKFSFGGSMLNPVALEFGQGGAFGKSLYVLDRARGQIFTVAPDGTVSVFVRGLPTSSNQISSDLAFSPDGRSLFVALDDRIYEITAKTLNVAAPGVLSNDTGTPGFPLAALLLSQPSKGALLFNPDGSFSYTPGAAFRGTDSYTYKAVDGPLSSNATTVTITGNVDNLAPSVNAGADQTFTAPAKQVLFSDDFEDGAGKWVDPGSMVISDKAAQTGARSQTFGRVWGAGDARSDFIPVVPGRTYVLRGAYMTLGGGGFFGVENFTAGKSYKSHYWLWGDGSDWAEATWPHYNVNHTPATELGRWRTYERAYTVPADTHFLRIITEDWSGGLPNDPTNRGVFFDNIELYTYATPTTTLNGAAGDDGLPAGSTLSTAWSMLSGPSGGAVTFGSASQAATTAGFSAPGSYRLRLSASDSQLSTQDDVAINVLAANRAPQPNPGPDLTLTMAAGTTTLAGSVADDGLPAGAPVSAAWSSAGARALTIPAPLSDDFDDNAFDALKWGTFTAGALGAQLLERNQRLEFHPGTQNGGGNFRSPGYLDPRGRTLSFKYGGYNRALDQTTRFTVRDDGAWTTIWANVGHGRIDFSSDSFHDGQSRQDGTFAYDGSAPVWIRWRQSDSQFFWDTSADGVNWTNRASATFFRPATGAQFVKFDYYSPAGGPVIHIDDFKSNIPTYNKAVGPGSVTFANPNAAATAATFSAPGLYLVRLTASDTQFSNLNDALVTVHPANKPPTVSAGPARTVSLPAAVSLDADVNDDGYPLSGATPSSISVTWTKVSGPGAVTFAQPNRAVTTATFGTHGTYVLRLTASDSQLSASGDVTVNVTTPNQAPVVNAGADQTVVLPAQAALSGSATDDGLPSGSALAYTWAKVGGPGTVTFTNADAAATSAAFGAPGTYVLRLTASDSDKTASDDLTVTVNAPPNAAPDADAGPDQTVTPGLNLVQNSGNEKPTVNGVIPGWTQISGAWAQAPAGTGSFYESIEGDTYFKAGDAGVAELRQDVDVSAYAANIKTGAQEFELRAYVRSGAEDPADSAQVLFEFRDASNQNVLGTGNSGVITTSEGWHLTEGVGPAPAGTRWIRVRLLATRNSGATNDVYFDAVSLRALSNAGAKLAGAVADDGWPAGSTPAATWTKVSGPGAVAFDDAAAASTSATFAAPGAYVLKLSVTDTQLSDEDLVTVNVTAPNREPAVSAGANQTVTLPNPTALAGSVSDDGLPLGVGVAARWRKVAGPGEVTFADPNAASTEVSFTEPGNYVLRLTADDSDRSAQDDLTVTVKPAPVNAAPAVEAGPNQTVSLPGLANLAGQASDDGLPAGSTLAHTWSVASGPGTVNFTNPNSPATTAAFSSEGVYTLRLTASDSQLSAADELTVTVRPQGTNSAPGVSAGPDQEVRRPDALTLYGSATDDGLPAGSSLAVSWAVVSGPGAVTFASPGAARTTATFAAAGTYVLRLTAADTELTSADDVSVTVYDPVTGPPPTVAFGSLAGGAEITEITAPKQITGTVSGGAWRLEYALVEDETAPPQQWQTFASGAGAVSNGLLGTFDPTLLLNGTYAVRLVSTDTSGQTSAASASVVVARQMKVGHFAISFNDLSLPVAGVPVQVTRTYDSRDKRRGDFGVGWTLGISSVRVQKTSPVGANWYETKSFAGLLQFCLESTKPHYVTVTFPEGKVYKFQAVPAKRCQQFQQFSTVQMTFVPVGGTRGTLAPLNGGSVIVAGSVPGPVDLVDINDPSGYYLNPTRFRLTTEDGTSFVLDQKAGIESVSTPAGETLQITRDGITHSSGAGVTFVRDPQGRIAEVRDPEGRSRLYTYDAAGDLESFKDAEGNTTRFAYEAGHFLTGMEVRSADGASVFRPLNNVYEGGRLVRQLDAEGREIKFEHDLANRREVIRDRLGHPTTYEYDERGNVVYTKDAEGAETRRTYDADDNVLTETTAEGTTTNVYDAAGNLERTTDPLGNVTEYTYNAMRRVTSVKDPLGRVTTTAYHEQSGLLLKTVDAEGNETRYEYEPFTTNVSAVIRVPKEDPSHPLVTSYPRYHTRLGLPFVEVDAAGGRTVYDYDASGNRTKQTVTRTKADGTREELTTEFKYDREGRLVKTIYPDGTFTEAKYNELGKQSWTKDQLGRETRYEYDAHGRLRRTVYPDDKKEEVEYDEEGRRKSSTDRGLRKTEYRYDKVGRLAETLYADGGKMTTKYDALGRVETQTRWLDATTKYTTAHRYEAEGKRRVVYVTDALSRTTKQVFDEARNLWKVTDAKGRTTTYEYDRNNRRVKVIHHDGTYDETKYDGLGQVAWRTDQARRKTGYGYDAAGRLVKVTDAALKETTYGYDEVGNQTSQTDAEGRTTLYEYDELGRRTRRTLPEGMSEVYEYHETGALKSRTDFEGKKTTYEYDELNRLKKKTPDASFGAAAVEFTYTASGRRETMADASGVTVYTYDARDRLLTKQTPSGTLTYTYDKLGNLKTLRSSNADGASVDYAYDELSRLKETADNRLAGSGVTSYKYDEVGNLESYTYGNGVRHLYEYNQLNRLEGLTVSRATSTLNSYSYQLGAAGNREGVTEAGGRSFTYTYDELYRLKGEAVSGDPQGVNGTVTYTYDDVGNREGRTSTLPGVGPQSFTYDKNDRLGGDTYDRNGSTTRAGGVTYSYDWENRLSSVNDGAVTYLYDGDGNRVAKTVGGVATTYLVDTNNLTGYAQVVEELQGGAVVRQYTYGHDLISQRQLIDGTWSVSYYGYDGHGSVRSLTDTSGAVTDTYTYDAFGTLISRAGATPNEYLYAGERLDAETGMYHLRARYMRPDTGRFWSMDEYEGHNSDPLTLHKYLYGASDPVNKVDPSGNYYNDLLGATVVSKTISTMSVFRATVALGLAATLVATTVFAPVRTRGGYLFRGDDEYSGGPIGMKLDSDEALAADVQTPWAHVRKRSSKSSRFTSFSESYKKARQFGRVIKVAIIDLLQLEGDGTIRIHDRGDVARIMRNHSDERIQRDANDVLEIMNKNEEVLIEGQIPPRVIRRAH
ncbi:MAG TPA: RHS repeat-associated core domain-containing protein [Pyrinomonadaceae bacterium]|nr:RHS repeat-associated core domain-containing protein [Pyrinomonadaceae bacterium]